MKRKLFVEILVSAFIKWLENHASLRAASLAYFIIMPLPSIFLVIMLILSQLFGETNSFQTLMQQITTIVGPAIANLIHQILETAATPFSSIVTSIITIVLALMGALGAFGVLQDTMNGIWGVTQVKLNLKQRLRRQLAPFLLISILGLTVIVWTGITTFLLDFITITLIPLASNTILILLQVVQFILSLALATLLFMIMYKYIPNLSIRWKDVRLAAVFTGSIFTITNYLIGAILEVFTITSVTGAAGALMILLLWIYLITLLIIYGAAFSKVYSEKMSLDVKNEEI
ncbi:MAG: YihY/virulence factor BrkB family protein [Candidatus Bathyarchaeota archaeon]|jgi:membrane protein